MNIEEAIKNIEKDFPEKKVAQMLDDEIPKWVDDGWEEDFDNESEAYEECGRGEAEDVVIDYIINTWIKKYNQNKKLDLNNHLKLYERIGENMI